MASSPAVFDNNVVTSTASAQADTATKWFVKIFTFGLKDDGSEIANALLNLEVKSKIDLRGRFHLGGGAAGSFVDIDENGIIHYSGLDSDIKSAGSVDGDTITLNKLYNDDRGSLTAKAQYGDGTFSEDSVEFDVSTNVNITVYDSSFLPNVVIRNRSGMNLVLDNITVDNGKQPRPDLSVSGTNSSLTTTYAYEIPKDYRKQISDAILDKLDADMLYRSKCWLVFGWKI